MRLRIRGLSSLRRANPHPLDALDDPVALIMSAATANADQGVRHGFEFNGASFTSSSAGAASDTSSAAPVAREVPENPFCQYSRTDTDGDVAGPVS